MARPTKNNAAYFSHDADMRNDVKIKALRRSFHHTGYAVWCFFLELLTDADFFEIEFDDVSKELLAADFEVSVEELEAIVEYCLKIGLLQLTDENKLFSDAHQKRFASLLTKRERDRVRLQNQNNKQDTQQDIFASDNVNFVDNRSDNPHSKEKETKIEDIKEKESKRKTYPFQDIADFWNSKCGDFLPKIQKLSEARKQKIKARLTEFGESDAWMPTIENIFNQIASSDFLRGENSHNWQATFDWVFENPKNWVKIIEGNYDNNRGKKGNIGNTKITLGVGEYFDNNGRRTYGSGSATIPPTAPPRPSDKHCWDSSSQSWILL